MKVEYRLISQEKVLRKDGTELYIARVLITINSKSEILYTKLASSKRFPGAGFVEINLQKLLEQNTFFIDSVENKE